MNLEARKLTIIEKFIHIQNDDIITQVEKILANVKGIPENQLFKPFTKDELNNRIKKSMNDSNNGNLISNKDLKSEIDEWN
jgi:2-phospho-L-lactate guanylyltransferase (CobY/MobA/RfbA family)